MNRIDIDEYLLTFFSRSFRAMVKVVMDVFWLLVSNKQWPNREIGYCEFILWQRLFLYRDLSPQPLNIVKVFIKIFDVNHVDEFR